MTIDRQRDSLVRKDRLTRAIVVVGRILIRPFSRGGAGGRWRGSRRRRATPTDVVARTDANRALALSLAHELNQPLGAIAIYAEGCLIALDSPDPNLDEVRDALTRIRDATLRAGRIVEQARDVVEGRPRAPHAVDPGQAVHDVLNVVDAEVRRSGAAVRIDLASDLPKVWGDPVQLQQVLVNLIQNALQAFERSQVPAPTLVVSTRRCGPDEVEFAVIDNGPGVAPHDRRRIFDAQFSSRAEGMGMGLAICRAIAEAHQGRLTLESEPGLRTTFRFQVPTNRPDHERTDRLCRG